MSVLFKNCSKTTLFHWKLLRMAHKRYHENFYAVLCRLRRKVERIIRLSIHWRGLPRITYLLYIIKSTWLLIVKAPVISASSVVAPLNSLIVDLAAMAIILSLEKAMTLALGSCWLVIQISALKMIKSIVGASFWQGKAKISGYIKSKGLKNIGLFKPNWCRFNPRNIG